VLAPTAAAAFGVPDDPTFVRYEVPLKDERSMSDAMAVNWLHYLGGQEARLDRLPQPSADLPLERRAAALRKQENTRTFYDRVRKTSTRSRPA
jgi:hypothetical protein